jgi:hypothetical protein
MARAFEDGQLLVGAGARWTALSVLNSDTNSQLFTTAGVGFEAGVLICPNESRIRVGAAFHSAVTTRPNRAAETLNPGSAQNELWLPNQVTLPWDLNIGAAVQLGPRPFNPRWYDPSVLLARIREAMALRERARQRRRELLLGRIRAAGLDVAAATEAIDAELEAQAALDAIHLDMEEQRIDDELRERVRRMQRRYVLLSSSLVVTGSSANAVGVESFIQRVVDRSGESVVFSPRFGAESEIIPNWVKVRAGTYGEPTRVRGASARWHGTFGFDVKLLRWSVFGLFRDDTEWRLSVSLDAAPRYLSSGLSIGNWH